MIAQAAEHVGVSPADIVPAEDAGLVEIGLHVRFRHPLVRLAAYRSATPSERRQAHEALAAATDPERDPDRRAWHRALGASGPDEGAAAQLERSASRAKARGGLAAAAAFLARAAELSPDPTQRGQRALTAARLKFDAAAPESAEYLLTIAAASPLEELDRARLKRLRAQIALCTALIRAVQRAARASPSRLPSGPARCFTTASANTQRRGPPQNEPTTPMGSGSVSGCCPS